MKAFNEFQLNEVLSKSDPIEKWIHDFVHSDNPKFAGKSKEERIKMAQGAYYGAQNESTVDTADIEKNKNISKDDKEKLGKVADLLKKQVKEESGEHHDIEHVMKTMKKVDYDTYVKHMNKHDADHSMENKHGVDTQHSGSYTGKIHGAEIGHKHSKSGQKEYYIKEENVEESRGHKILATALGNMERMKTVQIPTPAERRAELEKQKQEKEKTMKESADNKTRHTVRVQVSDPRDETNFKERKALSVLASSPEDAEKAARKHFEGRGYTVHSVEAKKPVKEEVELSEAKEPWEVYDTKTRVVHSSHDTKRKAYNAMNKLNDKHAGYDSPGGLVQSKFGARASSYKEQFAKFNEFNEPVVEAAQDTLGSHKVIVTVSDPNHTAVSQRKEKVMKRVVVKALGRDDAKAKAEDFYKKKGYKVHDSEYHSKVPNATMKTEEVELDEAAWGKDKMTNLRQAHDRHMEKALAANKAGDDEAVKVHQRKMQMIQGKMQKLKNNEEVELGEECEILSELSKTTLKSYINKSSTDIGLRGMKAGEKKTFDKGSLDNLKKMSNRVKGIDKAADKLTKEEVEELDELDKKTLGSYVNKAHDQLMKHTSTVATKYARGDKDAISYALDKDALRKTANRTQGVKTAINKLTKEEVDLQEQAPVASVPGDKWKDHAVMVHPETKRRVVINRNNKKDYEKDGWKETSPGMKEETMVSYKEFMASIEEGKIDDLKDKLAADREKRLNKMDFSKEPEHKVSAVKKVAGHSYGAGEEDDEAGEKSKPAEPAQKRGRGRPAGSKSGARV